MKYQCYVRSNRFAVKDLPKFLQVMGELGIDVDAADGQGRVAIYRSDRDSDWTTQHSDSGADDVRDVVMEHLADDEVAIFLEAGAHETRSGAPSEIFGAVMAVHPAKGVIEFSLNSIFERVEKEWGVTPARAF